MLVLLFLVANAAIWTTSWMANKHKPYTFSTLIAFIVVEICVLALYFDSFVQRTCIHRVSP